MSARSPSTPGPEGPNRSPRATDPSPRAANQSPRATHPSRGAVTRGRPAPGRSRRAPAEGLTLLGAIVLVMWVLEAINSVAPGLHLDSDGIWPRNIGHLWGVLTAPFLHVSFQHLIDNTIPFVFMGAIIALRGAARLALVTALVIVLGGLGTWLIAPAGADTVGASGVVFGYATYLFTRGLFNRSLLEILTGVIVGAVWGAVLLASLVPHYGVSWQAHACGAAAGVVAAWLLSGADGRPGRLWHGGRRGSADALTRALAE